VIDTLPCPDCRHTAGTHAQDCSVVVLDHAEEAQA